MTWTVDMRRAVTVVMELWSLPRSSPCIDMIFSSCGQRSNSNACHNTVLWSYTNKPNIIDSSWKENKLWPRQASTIILPLVDLGVRGQCQMNAMTVHNTSSYDHTLTYQISLTYLNKDKIVMVRISFAEKWTRKKRNKKSD